MTASYTTSGIPVRFAGPSTLDDYLTPVTSPLPTAVPNSTPSSTPPPSATDSSPPSPEVLAAHEPHGRGTDNGALVALTREASMEEYLSVTAGQRRVSIESGLRVGLGMPFDERGVGEQVGPEGRRESMGRKRDYGMVEVGLGVVEGEGGGVAKTRMIRDLMKALGEEKSRTAALELNLFGAHQEIEALKSKIHSRESTGSRDIERSQQATIQFLLSDVEAMRRKLNKAEEIELDVLAEYEVVMRSRHSSGRSSGDSTGHANGGAGGYKFGGIDPRPSSSTLPTALSTIHPYPTSPSMDPTYSLPSASAGLSQSTLDSPADQKTSATASSLPSSDSIDPLDPVPVAIDVSMDSPSSSSPPLPGTLAQGYVGKEPVGDEEIPREIRCVCHPVHFGDMIRCGGRECKKEWFHLPCVGLQAIPKVRWYCEECRRKEGRLRADAGTWTG